MNAAELVTALRVDIDDVAEPHLWTDAELYRAVDQAQKTFCRLTQGIPDVLPIDLAADEEWYERDPRILKIRGVRRLYADNTSIGRPVIVMSFAQFQASGQYFDSRSGPVSVLIDGERKGYLRAYPMPSIEDPLEVTVLRLPDDIENGSTAELEIDERHHEFLLDGAKARLYLKQDSDTLDKKQAADADARFKAYCFESKQEQERNEFGVGTVAYGGYEINC